MSLAQLGITPDLSGLEDFLERRRGLFLGLGQGALPDFAVCAETGAAAGAGDGCLILSLVIEGDRAQQPLRLDAASGLARPWLAKAIPSRAPNPMNGEDLKS